MAYFTLDDNETIGGLSFKINNKENFVPCRIGNLVGVHQLYGILAAVAIGNHFGMNLVEISKSLEGIEVPAGRLTLCRGIKNSMVIDDAYNASPASTHAALDVLKNFAEAESKLQNRTVRRIAVLGDMKELGKYEIEAHQAIGNLAGERTDVLVTVGAAAKFIADSAANQMKPDTIFSFSTSDEAKTKVKELIQEGDVILVKGSHSMQMEKVVEEIVKF